MSYCRCYAAPRWAAFVLLSVILPTAAVRADTVFSAPVKTDAELHALPGVQSATSSAARVGLTTTNGFGRAAEFVFDFPKVPFGERITDASITITLKSVVGNFSFNGDLYSLGTSNSSAAVASDYYHGAFGGSSGGTALQDNFLVPSSAVGAITTSTAGRAALAQDIEAERIGGAASGLYYFLRLSPDFTAATSTISGYNVAMTEDTTAKPVLSVTTQPSPQKGRVLIEYWTGIAGQSLSALTSSPQFPNQPSHREWPLSVETPAGLAPDAGARIRAYYHPPVTGSYRFAVAGGDTAELLLSSDEQPSNTATIATLPAASGFRVWNAYASQTSAPVSLQAGRRYYLEVRQKQGASGGVVSVGQIVPAGTSVDLMPVESCEPYDPAVEYSGYAALESRLTQGHPRLMLSPAAVLRLRAAVAVPGSIAANWHASMRTRGETMLTAAYGTNPNDPRPAQHAVYTLSLLYLLSDDVPQKAQYKTRIYNELVNVIGWGNWAAYEFLDVGENANTFAIAYDWLYPDWTPSERSVILAAIRDQALTPAINQYAANAWWVEDPYNWSIVVNSGITLGALAILGDETSVSRAVLDCSLGALRDGPAIGHLGPDGGSRESHGYWDFSVRFLTALLASCETATATDFNLDQRSGGSSIGSFALYNTGPFRRVFNFADHSGDTLPQTWGTQYLSVKYNQPVYAWLQKQVALPYPLDLVWYDPRTASPASLLLPASTYFRNAGIVSLRDHWGDNNSLFAALKSGGNGIGHSQLELGSFVFDALGVRWIEDLGRENTSLANFYTTNPTVSPNRWIYYRNRAEGNNTLVINPGAGPDQLLAAVAPVTKFSGIPENPSAVIDLASAYSDKVTGLLRGFRLINGTAQLQDELVSAVAVDANWFLHTATTVTLSADARTATLASGTKRLDLRIQAPAAATFTLMAAEPLPMSPNPSGMASNASYQKLRIRLASTTSTTLTLAFLPYDDASTAPTAPSVATLANWPGADVSAVLPGSPTGLAATPGNAQVTLAWTPVAGATRYLVKRTYATLAPYATVGFDVTTATFTDGGLTNGSTYYYVVTAVNGAGESLPSAVVIARPTAPPAPGAPAAFSAVSSNGQVTLSWTAASGANTYTIRQASTVTGPFTTVASGLISTSHTVSGLANGAPVYFVVVAVNTAGIETTSSWVGTTPSVAGDAPISVEALTAIGGDSHVVLAWKAATVGTTYRIKRAASTNGPFEEIGTGVTNVKFTDTGLANGQRFYYTVAGINSSGVGPDVQTVSAVPGTTSTLASAADVYVRDGTSSALNYGTETTLIVKADATSFRREAYLKFNVAGLENAESVQLRLVPTLVDAAAPEVACEFVADDAWNAGSLTWQSRPATTGQTAGILPALAANIPVTLDVTSLAQSEAAGDGVLSLRLHSLTFGSSSGATFGASRHMNSQLRPQLVVTLGPPAPLAPSELSAVVAAPETVDLNWTASADATSYNVLRATEPGGGFEEIATAVTTASFTDSTVVAGNTYRYAVQARNRAGTSPASESEEITLPKRTGSVVLGELYQIYDGTVRSVTVGTDPKGLPVNVLYHGATDLPREVGSRVPRRKTGGHQFRCYVSACPARFGQAQHHGCVSCIRLCPN